MKHISYQFFLPFLSVFLSFFLSFLTLLLWTNILQYGIPTLHIRWITNKLAKYHYKKILFSLRRFRGIVVKDAGYDSFAPKLVWVWIPTATLDFLWESYPANLRSICGSTHLPARGWNNTRRDTWGLKNWKSWRMNFEINRTNKQSRMFYFRSLKVVQHKIFVVLWSFSSWVVSIFLLH